MNVERIRKLAEDAYPWAVELRRALHRIPEPGFEEFETQKLICDTLDALGIPYQTHRTWVIAYIEGAHPGRVVGFRADIDALPVTEPEGVAFRSQHEGWMHACGHDAHTAIQLGVAKILNSMKDRLRGGVKLLFQPAEETEGGAKPMVEAGALENPRVDACYGLHLMSRLPLGAVETRYGTLNASTDDVILDIRGRGGHAAYPENSVDAIVCAAHVVTALQTLVSRNVSPLSSAVLSFGIMEGGRAANIVCEHVRLKGTLRTADPELRASLQKRIREVASGVASAFGGSAEVNIVEGYSALVNHPREAKLVLDTAAALFGPENVILKEGPSMGGEDFSYFIEKTPGAFYHIGCTPKEDLPAPALHSPLFRPDERCLLTGLMMQTAIALHETGTEDEA
jgi:amidohydrolase